MSGEHGDAQSTVKRERLDIPSLSAVERQLLVSSTSAPTSKKPTIQAPTQSVLLDRLRTFLPSMHTANTQLASQAPESVSVEFQGNADEPHIEMDLACGILDLNTEEAEAAAERALAGLEPHSIKAGVDNSDSDDDDSDEEEQEALDDKPVAQANVEEVKEGQCPISTISDAEGMSRPGPGAGKRRKRAKIVEL